MSKATVATLEKTIHSRYRLTRKDRYWLLNEGVRLRAPNRHAFGFSLDRQDLKPFAFFSDTPPEHVAKMCDAIIALSHEDNLYLFIIEQKTANPDAYKKQLTNGKLFCDWLCALFRKHGYLGAEPTFIGLLVWQPRPSPSKGTTTHDDDKVGELDMTDLSVHRGFQAKNQQDIRLKTLIERAHKAHISGS